MRGLELAWDEVFREGESRRHSAAAIDRLMNQIGMGHFRQHAMSYPWRYTFFGKLAGDLAKELSRQGIFVSSLYPPLNKSFESSRKDDFPNCRLLGTLYNIPLNNDREKIVKAVRAAVSELGSFKFKFKRIIKRLKSKDDVKES